MNPIIEVTNLEKTFGSVVAARDINLKIETGQFVGIIGANGAGKTTFVNMVTGYLKPTSGKISYKGQDITGLAPEDLTRVGLTRSFQIAQVFPALSASDNVLMAVGATDKFRGRCGLLEPLATPERHAKAARILEEYDLTAHAGKPAGELPQGVRKLLDIAMAVASEPSAILLDEPTSGVSAEDKFSIMDRIIGALKNDAITTLFVEHDMDIVARYADRVLAFVDGTIIADGTPDQVFSDPRVREMIVGEVIERVAKNAETTRETDDA